MILKHNEYRIERNHMDGTGYHHILTCNKLGQALQEYYIQKTMNPVGVRIQIRMVSDWEDLEIYDQTKEKHNSL